MALDLNERAKLVEALLKCECMKTPQSRSRIVRELPDEIQQRIGAGGTSKEDIDELVRVCDQFEDGIDALLQRVRYFEGASSYAWKELAQLGYGTSAPSTTTPARRGLGEAVYRLCDRDSQEDDFDEFIRGNRSSVLICAIPAEERECPDSLGKRFTETIIKPYAQDRWGAQEGVINSKLIAWPEVGEPKTRQQRLLTRLWREVDCNRRTLSAEDFGQEISTKLERVIVLRHTVRLQSWDEGERDLLEWYLGFWDDVNRQQPKPQLMVLFNLLYPDKPDSLWKAWLPGRRRFNREAVGAQIREMFGDAGCPKRVLEELPCVKYDDVKDWFDYYEIFDEGERVSICKKLFHGAECRPMAEIEKALKQYHQDFLSQRG